MKWAPSITASSRIRSRWRAASSSRRPSGTTTSSSAPSRRAALQAVRTRRCAPSTGRATTITRSSMIGGDAAVPGRGGALVLVVHRPGHLPEGHLAQGPEVGGR